VQRKIDSVNRPNILKRSPTVPHVRHGSRPPRAASSTVPQRSGEFGSMCPAKTLGSWSGLHVCRSTRIFEELFKIVLR
jgi:hypothetical protein